MPEKTLHDTLIDELLDYRTVLTPRENAAAWKIRELQAQLENRPIEEVVKANLISKPVKKPAKKAAAKGKKK